MSQISEVATQNTTNEKIRYDKLVRSHVLYIKYPYKSFGAHLKSLVKCMGVFYCHQKYCLDIYCIGYNICDVSCTKPARKQNTRLINSLLLDHQVTVVCQVPLKVGAFVAQVLVAHTTERQLWGRRRTVHEHCLQ